MEHQTLFNLINWQIRSSQIWRGERTLRFASLAFDASLEEIFSTWCTGGTLEPVAEHTRRDREAMYDLIENAGIARLILANVALQGLAIVAAARKAAPQCLRQVFVGSQALRIIDQIRSLFCPYAKLRPG